MGLCQQDPCLCVFSTAASEITHMQISWSPESKQHESMADYNAACHASGPHNEARDKQCTDRSLSLWPVPLGLGIAAGKTMRVHVSSSSSPEQHDGTRNEEQPTIHGDLTKD